VFVMSLAQANADGINRYRGEKSASPRVSERTVTVAIGLVALQLVLNAIFNEEGERAVPYMAMALLTGVAGWHAIWWHLTCREARLFPALHYVVVALGAYVAIDAYWLSDGDGTFEVTDVARYVFWILGYYFFYAAARSQAINERHIKGLLICAIPVILLVLRHDAIADVEMRQGYSYSAVNVGYTCLALAPWALLLKRSFVKEIAIVLCAIGVLLSLKRGAMLAFVVAGFVTSMLFLRGRDWVSPRRVFAVVALVIALGAAAYVRWDGLKYRLNKGGGDRQTLREGYMQELARSTSEEWWFGHGAMATTRICLIRAHCDWIEIWFNYGFIGLLLFAVMFALLGVGCARSFLLREPAATALCFSVIAVFLASLYAGVLSTPTLLMYSSIFGLAHGRYGMTSEPVEPVLVARSSFSRSRSPEQDGPPLLHRAATTLKSPSRARSHASTLLVPDDISHRRSE
jgi:hypothetical protein